MSIVYTDDMKTLEYMTKELSAAGYSHQLIADTIITEIGVFISRATVQRAASGKQVHYSSGKGIELLYNRELQILTDSKGG